MKRINYLILISLFFGLIVSCTPSVKDSANTSSNIESNGSLPSWNDGETKKEIIAYVADVTNTDSPNFIPKGDRIATFDNDGTLWSEQPAYFQLFFAIDKINKMAVDYPVWKTEQPFKAVLENNMEELMQQGTKALLKLILVSHSGTNQQEFSEEIKQWIKTAKHPTKKVTYDKLVYQPMLELLDYLRANGFKTYIVSGGGVDFMRAFVSEIYGIPSEQIIGTRLKTEWVYENGSPQINRLPEFEFVDDKEGKPLNIQKIIGKKPVFSGGNSDGDLQMMQWTASNKYKSFMLYVHHTDSVREWAYDRNSHIGKFDKGLDQAISDGWTVIDMAKDWKVVYPFEK